MLVVHPATMRRILAVGGLGCASAAAAAGLSDEGLRRSVQFWANVSRVVTSTIHRDTRLFVSTKLSDTPIARCTVSTTICSARAFTSVLAIEADDGVYQVGPVYAHYRGVQFVNDMGLISDARADTLYNELHGLYESLGFDRCVRRAASIVQVFEPHKGPDLPHARLLLEERAAHVHSRRLCATAIHGDAFRRRYAVPPQYMAQ